MLDFLCQLNLRRGAIALRRGAILHKIQNSLRSPIVKFFPNHHRLVQTLVFHIYPYCP
jgi:hypothetical protein